LGLRAKLLKQSKEDDMSTIHLHERTTATPEQFIAALTDFGRAARLSGQQCRRVLKGHDVPEADHRGPAASGEVALRLVGSEPRASEDDRLARAETPAYTFVRNPDGTIDLTRSSSATARTQGARPSSNRRQSHLSRRWPTQ
jgi:hypothetical protein